MTYVYDCSSCEKRFDVIKSYKDMEREETCPTCGKSAARQFVPSRLHLSKTRVTHAEYNPGLGCVVKNERHKDYVMKSKGVIEVGNDFGSGEKMQDAYDSARAEKRAKAYDDV